MKLGTLRPVYEEDKHGLYVDLLVRDLAGETPPRNVAISGAYGSGKSSVVEGLMKRLGDKSIESMQISLATLNQSRQAILEVSGEETLTAALEKEVVKRLLYSAKPSTIPRSRYQRIIGFQPKPAAAIAFVCGLGVTGAAAAFDVALPLEQVVAAWQWKQWLAPVFDTLSVSALAFAGQAALSKFKLRQVAVGPASVALADHDANDFDRYLDEIVYFFERTGTRVVAFEDLDRFDDPGIFLALRELNNLLNSSKQITQPISFVYAIRDSLFVKAIEPDEPPPESPPELPGPPIVSGRLDLPDSHARHGVDSAASDRAKFFDLIVPIVPFISHEVAADLLVTALADLPDDLQPSRNLASLAGGHFADMRVIHSIRNEYEVFAAELLRKSPVEGLSADHLFAMMLYKHLYLEDFERIRTGNSTLDAATDLIRAAVADLIEAVDRTIAAAEDAIQAERAVDQRAVAAGHRLLDLLDAMLRFQGWGPVQTLTVDATQPFPREQVTASDFWTALGNSENPTLHVQSPNGTNVIAADDLPLLLGPDRNPKAWARREIEKDQQRLEQLKQAREWVRRATFAELLSGPYPSAKIDEIEWTQARDDCLDLIGEGLLFDLFRQGYIDRDFALYTTKFHGAILSARARTYLMQYVDRHRSDPHFELSDSDVDEIFNRRGEALLSDDSSLNLSIVDRLLEQQAPRLPDALVETGRAAEFLETYLADGQFGDDLLKRLTACRRDILDVVSEASRLSELDRRRCLNSCVSALARDIGYTLSPTTIALLADAIETLPAFETELEPATAEAIADLMRFNDLRITDLERLRDPLRRAVIEAGRFDVTRANLATITQSADKVGLDTVLEIAEAGGTHLVANMADYLAAVRQTPAGSIVDDAANFDRVVRAIAAGASEHLSAALELRPPAASYTDLSAAPADAYGDLARSGAFLVNRANISRYVDTVGTIDANLADLLQTAAEIDVDEASDEADEVEGHAAAEEEARQKLARLIVTSDQLDPDAKVSLVVSLKTTNTLDVDELQLADPRLASELLRVGEVADDLTTFTALTSAPWPVFEACAVESSKLPSFIGELGFTDSLLREVLESARVGETAQRAMLDHFESIDQALGSASAPAWLRTALRLNVQLAPAQLARLAQAGAPTGKVLDYVAQAKPPIAATDLVAVLAQCDQPYSALATPNGSKFTVPLTETSRRILQTLKDGGVVRSFHKKRLRDVADVQMAG